MKKYFFNTGSYSLLFFTSIILLFVLIIDSTYNISNCTTISVPDDFQNIQDAIDSTSNGDIIIIRNGIYKGIGNFNIDFKGKAITMTSESGPNFCTINCEKQGKAFIFQNGEDSSTVISGLTIKNCSITSSDDDAGGILCYSSSPKIENCLFKEIVGYVIYCSSTSNPTIKSCSFINNRGTGIRCSSSSPTIEDCIFKKNFDHKEKIGQEGNSTYYKVYKGSGVFCSNSSPYIGNCIIEDNERIAIEIVQDSSPHIIDCKIKNNSQGIYINASTPTIVKCTISHNISYFISGTYYYGGGVSFRDAGGYIDKCTIYENGADYGGGIAVYESKPEISNSLIFNNYASEAGGGLFIKYHFTGGPSANISFCAPLLTMQSMYVLHLPTLLIALFGGQF